MRNNGFYWVRIEDVWGIASYDDGYWFITGSEEIFKEEEFAEIGEEIIKNKLKFSLQDQWMEARYKDNFYAIYNTEGGEMVAVVTLPDGKQNYLKINSYDFEECVNICNQHAETI